MRRSLRLEVGLRASYQMKRDDVSSIFLLLPLAVSQGLSALQTRLVSWRHGMHDDSTYFDGLPSRLKQTVPFEDRPKMRQFYHHQGGVANGRLRGS